jgi:2-iminobutanoate/2-iminopropanoate deaminase
MPKEIISSQKAPAAIGPYSQAVKIGPLIFASGQLPLDPATGFKVQGGVGKETAQVLENLKAVLEAAGASLDKVVKTTVYLKTLEDFKFMNDVYQKYFPTNPPARSTVQAQPPKDALVEIDAIVVLG